MKGTQKGHDWFRVGPIKNIPSTIKTIPRRICPRKARATGDKWKISFSSSGAAGGRAVVDGGSVIKRAVFGGAPTGFSGTSIVPWHWGHFTCCPYKLSS